MNFTPIRKFAEINKKYNEFLEKSNFTFISESVKIFPIEIKVTGEEMAYFVYTLCGSLCSYFYSVHVLPQKLPWGKRLIIFLYAYLSAVVLNSRMGQFGTFITLFGIFLLIAYDTKGDFLSLSCAMFGYIFSVVCNYILLWGVSGILGNSIENLMLHDEFTIGFSIFSCIFCGVSTWIAGWIFREKLNLPEKISDTHLKMAIFAVMLLSVVIFALNIAYGEHMGYSYDVIGFNGALFLFFFLAIAVLMYFMYQKILEKQKLLNQLEQFEHLQEYTEKLEESYGSMRRFKHDYINILNTLSEFISQGNIAELQKYYQKVMSFGREFQEADIKLESLSRIHCLELKSLLSSKLIYSMEMGIHTGIELTEDIEELFMDTLDFSRIAGIFLDNAIEAALESQEKELEFCMFYKDDALNLIIQNSAKPVTIPLSDLCRPGISSKGGNRGIGLYNAARILESYPDIIWNMKYGKNSFTQRLVIPRP